MTLLTLFEPAFYRAGATLDLSHASDPMREALVVDPAEIERIVAEVDGGLPLASLPPPGPPWLGPAIERVRGRRDPASRFAEGLRIDQLGDGRVRVSVAARSPELAQSLADSITHSIRATARARRTQALESQLVEARREMAAQKRRLLDARRALAEHQLHHPVLVGEGVRESRIAGLEAERIEATKHRTELAALLESARQAGADAVEPMREDERLARLRQQRPGLVLELDELGQQFRPEYPEFARARRRLARLDQQIETEQDRLLSELALEHRTSIERERALREAIADERRAIHQEPGVDPRGASLEARVAMEQELLAAIRTRLDATIRDGEMRIAVPRLIESSARPERAAGPRALLRGVVAGAIVLAMSLTASAWRRWREWRLARRALRFEAFVEPAEPFGRLIAAPSHPRLGPSAGEIPLLPAGPLALEPNAGAVAGLAPTNIRGTRIFTCLRNGEGRTVTALRTAQALAQQGLRVVLVDADLREPSIHRLVGAREEPGLGDVVSRRTRCSDAIRSTRVANLAVLTAGRRSSAPERLIRSQEMVDLLHYLEERSDHVILCAPALESHPDTFCLAGSATAVTIVVDPVRSSPEEALEAEQRLREAGALAVETVSGRPIGPTGLSRSDGSDASTGPSRPPGWTGSPASPDRSTSAPVVIDVIP